MPKGAAQSGSRAPWAKRIMARSFISMLSPLRSNYGLRSPLRGGTRPRAYSCPLLIDIATVRFRYQKRAQPAEQRKGEEYPKAETPVARRVCRAAACDVQHQPDQRLQQCRAEKAAGVDH